MLRHCLLSLSLLALAACPAPGEDTPDAGGGLIPDVCNSRDEALSLPECALSLGESVERYISTEGDQDWYSVQLPATAGARTLVHVTAGYAVQSTAVNLAVNLLREDGQASLARKVDAHGQGAPRPVDLIVPFGEPGARLLLLVGDEPASASKPQVDTRAPYFLKVEVMDNPDTNEPNDSTATPVALADQGGAGQVGTGTGYLATTDDVDRFSFTLAAGKVAYVHLSAPALSPPPPYRLSYALVRPDGTKEAEGQMSNEFLAADLATARKVKTAGTWEVVVKAYRSPSNTQPIPGDLRQQYTLEVRVLDEADPSELSNDNDALQRATAQSLTGGPGPSAQVAFTGRLGSVPDRDWYAVDVPASTEPTVLRYRVTPLSSGGRFPALPGLEDRQALAFTRVPGDDRQACANDAVVCPKGYGSDTSLRDLVLGWCNNAEGALCLRSSREESDKLAALRNFAGALPVPPHAATVRYYFLVQDSGNNWADDKDYRLEVRWLADADEAARFSGGAEVETPKTLAEDSAGATFPAPPAGAAFEVSGTLSHGMGRLVEFNPLQGQGVRGPADYDAVVTDVDTYAFQLPGGLTEPMDRTWELQWEVEHLADGGTPHGLALDLTFCDGDDTDGGVVCTPVTKGSRGGALTLAYRGEPLRAWHSPTGSLSGLQPLYSRANGASSTTVTVQPYACSCLEPRFIRGGTLKVAVSAVDRKDYEPVQYTLRTAYTDYPKSYGGDGGMVSCPVPQLDDAGTAWLPGCNFTRQP